MNFSYTCLASRDGQPLYAATVIATGYRECVSLSAFASGYEECFPKDKGGNKSKIPVMHNSRRYDRQNNIKWRCIFPDEYKSDQERWQRWVDKVDGNHPINPEGHYPDPTMTFDNPWDFYAHIGYNRKKRKIIHPD